MNLDALFYIGNIVIRWQDILDIVIVAYIIYRLLLIIKGTIAVQMIFAFIVFFLMSKISSSHYMEFHTLNWILQHFWSVALIAIIVLFQPEIRRALVEFGRHKFFFRHENLNEKVINEIAKAADVFSTSRTGALIVLERKTGLQPIIELGSELDAAVTSEMLRSIFFPHSPLHDGAVIIKDFKIAAAGCFLPLTKNPFLPRRYGTRHRAAVGISEETDAVVAVVSEETGKISLVLGGRLESMSDHEELKRRLYEIYRIKK